MVDDWLGFEGFAFEKETFSLARVLDLQLEHCQAQSSMGPLPRSVSPHCLSTLRPPHPLFLDEIGCYQFLCYCPSAPRRHMAVLFPEVLWAHDRNTGEEDLSVVPQQRCRLPPLPRITPVWLCSYDPPPPCPRPCPSPAALDTEERGVPFTCMAIGSDQQLLQCEPGLGSSCGLQQGLSPGPLTLLQAGSLPPPSFQNPPEMELQPQARTCHRRQCLPALPG